MATVTFRRVRGLALGLAASAQLSCGTGRSDDIAIAGVTGEVILTRQRDLVDRGFVNVLLDNRSGDDLLISERTLDADHFRSKPDASPRPISVPNDRKIAIQVPFGDTDDCASDDPETASLRFTYTSGGDDASRTGAVELTGTEVLEGIRADQCAERVVGSQTEISFTHIVTTDEAVTADLSIRRTGGDATFEFDRPIGTVLVDVIAADDIFPVELGPTDVSLTIPLTFVVNRCDPHALAEVTKKFGLGINVAVDGNEPRPVAIDIAPLVTDLEAIVDACFAEADG